MELSEFIRTAKLGEFLKAQLPGVSEVLYDGDSIVAIGNCVDVRPDGQMYQDETGAWVSTTSVKEVIAVWATKWDRANGGETSIRVCPNDWQNIRFWAKRCQVNGYVDWGRTYS